MVHSYYVDYKKIKNKKSLLVYGACAGSSGCNGE